MIRSTRSGSSLFIVQLKTKNVRSYQNCSSTEQTCFEEGPVGNVKSLYERWLNDPNDVGPAWDSFFKTVSQQEKCKSKSPGLSYSDRNASIGKRPYHDKYDFEYFKKEEDQITDIDQVILVHRLIRSYQVRGHHLAKLDPLDQHRVERLPLFGRGKEALYRHYADEHVNLLRKVQYELNLDKTYPLPVSTTHIGGEEAMSLKLSEIIARLEKVYCDKIGLEYMHISSFSQCDYIRKQFETPNTFRITTEEKILLLSRLARAIGFEEFCDHYYPQAVRYSLEGCESLIPCIKAIIDHSTEVGVDHFIFGMAHRGRMNILTNIFRIPLTQIMPLFHRSEPERPGLGEAPFYLGADVVKRNRMTNKTTRLTMLATPAHVESVNAVALGRTKIEQMMRSKRSKVIPILIHGDMAFSGQGISYEILNLSDLPAFNTRGTIHIILNNQLASGSDVQTMRSQAYSTDLGKIINAPIFHVNADDPEAVRHVSMVAAKWRSVFKMDCIVELVAYRRYGQSTQDDRTITDPALSAKIEKTPNVYEKYVEQLRNENAIAEEELWKMDQYKEKYMDLLLTTHREVSKETKFFLPNWSDAPKISDFNKEPKKIPATGIEESDILSVGKTLTTPPPGDFVMHKAIAKLFSHRSSLLKQKVVNWSLAEAIAFGSLLKEGVHVRLSGLDVERSMWGNSHYVIHHQAREGTSYTPMDYLDPGQAKFSVHNTPSSQLSVLGFEIGYSQCDPNILVIWEAQDGDYANTAQVMLDEYLACGECKWKKPSGLVVNLPHGRNDMTVEHSSCRPERYLQMCADDVDSVELDYHKQMFNCNWIVTYPTTPANFFHALRRQIVMPFRKPLINILPRVLIAKDESVSPFADLISDTSYQRIIVENVDPHNVKTVVFCCGKVYYEFDAMRSKQNKHGSITFIRIEQISPFPYDLIMQEIAKYPHAKFVFAQEEPKNMGFHQYCVPRLQNILRNIPLRVVTTPSVAHASCRYPSEHLRQMVEVEKSIVGDPERRPKNQAVFRIDAFHSSVLAFGKNE